MKRHYLIVRIAAIIPVVFIFFKHTIAVSPGIRNEPVVLNPVNTIDMKACCGFLMKNYHLALIGTGACPQLYDFIGDSAVLVRKSCDPCIQHAALISEYNKPFVYVPEYDNGILPYVFGREKSADMYSWVTATDSIDRIKTLFVREQNDYRDGHIDSYKVHDELKDTLIYILVRYEHPADHSRYFKGYCFKTSQADQYVPFMISPADTAAMFTIHVNMLHPDEYYNVKDFAVSNDGKYIAVSFADPEDGTFIFNTETKKSDRLLFSQEPDKKILELPHQVFFTPDDHLCTLSQYWWPTEKNFKVWDLKYFKPVLTKMVYWDFGCRVAFSPGGAYYISKKDNVVALYSTLTEQKSGYLSVPAEFVRDIPNFNALNNQANKRNIKYTGDGIRAIISTPDLHWVVVYSTIDEVGNVSSTGGQPSAGIPVGQYMDVFDLSAVLDGKPDNLFNKK